MLPTEIAKIAIHTNDRIQDYPAGNQFTLQS